MKLIKEDLNKKGWWKVGKFILTSAPFALLLSIGFFWYEMYTSDQESDKMIADLRTIEQSLSTRHIGIFPDYLNEINKLLKETLNSPQDTIIIFEDVLFYGAFYNGEAFKNMILQLSKLANENKKIVIAYYDNSKNWQKGRMFREVVQESWMRQEDLSRLTQYRIMLMDSLRTKNNNGRGSFTLPVADSIASEKYFALYRDDESNVFSQRRKKILVPFYDVAKNDNMLFADLDRIKMECFDKSEKDITFSDIFQVYDKTTERLKSFFREHNIKTIPLNNYLTMSCWYNGEKVLFAFPGRFAADEIGFISHDEAILKYIKTMLDGAQKTASNDQKFGH
ncbi:MAG: hypothetical protein LBM67_05010 [Lentimicrobiaceae bacterium]|jgi:hypothetical protein|nr:hypothetical protein [Lentimicrobiaceae bacterium]